MSLIKSYHVDNANHSCLEGWGGMHIWFSFGGGGESCNEVIYLFKNKVIPILLTGHIYIYIYIAKIGGEVGCFFSFN